jgi:predicted ATP-grasp superfamily ATP-dependent carboligase
MLKPLRGAAGRGIRIWVDHGTEHASLHEPHYFQQRRVGVPYSALFLALPQRATLLGIARQLVGLREVHAPAFAWCGTITPVELPPVTAEIMTQIGDVLAQRTGLRGLFGCDFIIDQDAPWLTEVNPRYPASTELIERVLKVPLLDWHRRACESFGDSGTAFVVPTVDVAGTKSSHGSSSREHPATILGKIVRYASRDLAAPDAGRFLHPPTDCHDSGEFDDTLAYMADISAPGIPIARGQPICTLFARASNESDCLAKLVRRAARFETQIK